MSGRKKSENRAVRGGVSLRERWCQRSGDLRAGEL